MRGLFRHTPARRRAIVLSAVALAVAAGWLAIERPLATSQQPVASAPLARPTALPAASADSLRPDMAGAEASVAEATARVARLLQHGSLRGTQMDGDWGRWVDGRLQPSRSLRLRFDYLLAGLGEVSVADLRPWIGQQVRASLGEAAVGQVLDIWDRYLTALRSATEVRRDPADAQAWQQASAQLGMLRRNALGPAWAHAFFADEDRADEAFIARRQLAGAPAAPGDSSAAEALRETLLAPAASGLTTEQLTARDAQRVAAFGAEAAERLRAEDAARAAWAQQLASVRERLAAIAADPQLSTLQRQQAREAEIARQYSGTALIRARALLAEAP